MKELVLIDERMMLAKALNSRFKSFYKKKRKIAYNEVVFVGDDSFLCDYLLWAVDKSNNKFPVFKNVSYVDNGDLNDYRKSVLEETTAEIKSFDSFSFGSDSKPIFFFFVDCDNLASKDATLDKLNKVFAYMKKNTDARCLISAMLPEFDEYKSDATSLAEREFSFFLEKVCERTPQIDYYIELEKLCRANMRENELNLSLLRFDNVIAPDKYHTHGFDIENIVKDAFDNKKIVVDDNDFKDVFSVSYVRDACVKIFVSSYSAKKGHIYNPNKENNQKELFVLPQAIVSANEPENVPIGTLWYDINTNNS